MRWFKHMTASANDERLSRLKDAYGLEGYGFWWSVVEIVAEKVDANAQTSVEFSLKKWGNLLGISPKKFRMLAEYCAKIGLFFAKLNADSLVIDIPNILKFRDEYTERQHKKSGQSRDKLRPSRARETDTDTDIDTETDIETNTDTDAETKNYARKLFPEEEAGGAWRDLARGGAGLGENSGAAASGELARDLCGEPFRGPGGEAVRGHGGTPFDEQPDLEFLELRQYYDAHGRPGAPMEGYREYKFLRAGRAWPGQAAIYEAIERLCREDTQWRDGYAPNLSRFLREKWWKKQPQATAPPRRAGPDAIAGNAEVSRQVLAEREARRRQNAQIG